MLKQTRAKSQLSVVLSQEPASHVCGQQILAATAPADQREPGHGERHGSLTQSHSHLPRREPRMKAGQPKTALRAGGPAYAVRSAAISSKAATNLPQSSNACATESVHSSSRPGVMKTPRFML